MFAEKAKPQVGICWEYFMLHWCHNITYFRLIDNIYVNGQDIKSVRTCTNILKQCLRWPGQGPGLGWIMSRSLCNVGILKHFKKLIRFIIAFRIPPSHHQFLVCINQLILVCHILHLCHIPTFAAKKDWGTNSNFWQTDGQNKYGNIRKNYLDTLSTALSWQYYGHFIVFDHHYYYHILPVFKYKYKV